MLFRLQTRGEGILTSIESTQVMSMERRFSSESEHLSINGVLI